MTEESSFIRTICTYPDEIGPRLIYADWLEENGHRLDPENYEQRVASIRVDGSLSRLWFMRRLKQSIAGFPKTYRLMEIPCPIESFRGTARDHILSRAALVRVRHGFIEQIIISQRAFLRSAKGLFSSHPVRDVFLANQVSDDGGQLVGRRFVSGARLSIGSWPECAIVAPIWDQLQAVPQARPPWMIRIYPSAESAYLDLPDACVAWGRELAGLPTRQRVHEPTRPLVGANG